MHTNHHDASSLYQLCTRIDELSAGCDADFDVVLDDLEREFAELRLQFSNE